MNENFYCDHIKAVQTVAESVVLQSISKALSEFKAFHKAKKDGCYDIRVLGYGTWRKWGFSSSYGVAILISTVTECGHCKLWRAKERSAEFEH